MARQTLNNGEPGSTFRGKLNSMFTELYNWIGNVANSILDIVYGTPTDGQVVKWNESAMRAEWGDDNAGVEGIDGISSSTASETTTQGTWDFDSVNVGTATLNQDGSSNLVLTDVSGSYTLTQLAAGGAGGGNIINGGDFSDDTLWTTGVL